MIAFGNPTRSDDGVGWHVAAQLRDDPRASGTRLLTVQQLTPELADELASADTVVFVDACIGPPGEVAVAPVEPQAVGAWTHEIDPGSLLRLTEELHGRAPRAVAVTVGGASFEPGTDLSALVCTAVPAAVDAVVGVGL